MPRNDEVSQQPNDRPSGIVRFEPILDSTEAAALLKIHPKTLQKMARAPERSADFKWENCGGFACRPCIHGSTKSLVSSRPAACKNSSTSRHRSATLIPGDRCRLNKEAFFCLNGRRIKKEV